MVINVTVKSNGGFLPDMSLLTQASNCVWFDGTNIVLRSILLINTLLTTLGGYSGDGLGTASL